MRRVKSECMGEEGAVLCIDSAFFVAWMAQYSRLPMCVCIYSANGADGQDELSIGSKAPLPLDSFLMLDSLH